ncbi:MAG: hypothetical protein GSR81_02425 [Desulfurococcales archaeon]|nr:hypothetical protein [Desulfurococcales archaeon]
MKWPESLVQAALCAVADTLGFSKAKNVSEEHLLKVLEKLIRNHPIEGRSLRRLLKAKRDLLQELVRRGYLTMHGGRQTYMLTTTGLQKALEECREE